VPGHCLAGDEHVMCDAFDGSQHLLGQQNVMVILTINLDLNEEQPSNAYF